MAHGGLGLRKFQFNRDGIFFFQGFGEAPNVRARTKEMQIHKFIEMKRMLHLLGSQKIQISIILNRKAYMSAIIKTNRHALEWIDTRMGKTDDATIEFKIPYEIFRVNSLSATLRIIISIVIKPLVSIKFKHIFNRLRIYLALFIEISLRIISRVFSSH